MYEQIREDTLYIMLYAVVTVMALIASCYLLFRQGNAFAADITLPVLSATIRMTTPSSTITSRKT